MAVELQALQCRLVCEVWAAPTVGSQNWGCMPPSGAKADAGCHRDGGRFRLAAQATRRPPVQAGCSTQWLALHVPTAVTPAAAAAKLPGAPVLITALNAPGSAEMTTDQVCIVSFTPGLVGYHTSVLLGVFRSYRCPPGKGQLLDDGLKACVANPWTEWRFWSDHGPLHGGTGSPFTLLPRNTPCPWRHLRDQQRRHAPHQQAASRSWLSCLRPVLLPPLQGAIYVTSGVPCIITPSWPSQLAELSPLVSLSPAAGRHLRDLQRRHEPQ